MNLAHRPPLQLTHDFGGIVPWLATKIDVSAEIFGDQRWANAKLIDERLSKKRKVLKNHALLWLQRNCAVNETTPSVDSRNDNGRIMARSMGQNLVRGGCPETRNLSSTGQSNGPIGILAPDVARNTPAC